MLEFAGIFAQQAAAPAAGVYPVVESRVVTTFSTNTTTHNVLMPETINSGDLLFVPFGNDGGATVTTPSGWSLRGTVDASGQGRMTVFARVATGDLAGTTVNFVTSASEEGAAIVYRISNWGGTLSDLAISSMALQSSPDPPSLTSGFGVYPTLWIAMVATSSPYTLTPTGPPTNYTNIQQAISNQTTAAIQMWTAERELTASSENPGAFSMARSENFVTGTFAIRGP